MRYLFDDCVLDTDRRELHRGAEAVSVAPQVLDLLTYLISSRERVVSKDDIIAAIWDGRVVSDSALTTRLKVARSAIGDTGEAQRLIKTLPRKGFRFIGEVREEPGTTNNALVEQTRHTLALPDTPVIGVPLIPSIRRDHDHEVGAEKTAARSDAGSSAGAGRSGSPERRQLTIMVCNMVGSMAPAAGLDPEDMRERIARFHKMVADVVARFDGFVAQYLGDGVHVYFGYPAAHEHDAEQAVRAGLAILDAVEALKASSGETFQARVGIATGLVVVGDHRGTGITQERVAIGETPNMAAQLQAVTAPGEVVIAASTRRLVGQMFDCRALGAIEVQGLARPLEAWQVRGETLGVNRFKARRTRELTPLVGRQEEMDLLLRRWDQAKAGEGRVVLLSGEPGIGKSRITESLVVKLESEPHVRFRYFCSPHHTHSPLYPLITQLERAARFEPGSSASAKLAKLEALLRPTVKNRPRDMPLIAELLAVPPDDHPELAVSPQQKREMTLMALLDLLDSVAASSPILMVFEDLHWIDPTSLDMLDRAIGVVSDLPVLMVGTFRPEFQPTWVGQPHVTMLPLSRLSRRDSAAIIGGFTEGKPLPEVVYEQILARTDGIPLFIEELTSTLLESELMRETPDRYVLDGPLPPLAIPTSLQASLVARLDRLATVKDVVQIGAAIGREFSHELIAAVGALTSVDIDSALERLTASGLIHRRGTLPDATYTFKHALVQDAAYSTLLKGQRQQLHARIAKVLVDRFPQRIENSPEIAAHHFSAAGLAEAAGYWRRAGQLATTGSANREAVNFFEKALRALDDLPGSQSVRAEGFEIRLELRRVLIQLGETRRVLEQVREAEILAEKLNDDNRRGRVYAFMTNALGQLGELDEPLMWGDRALAIANTQGSAELRSLTTTYLEMVHYYRGDYERVIELATENLAFLAFDRARANFGAAAPASVFDRHCLIMSLAQLGRFAEAAECETEAIQLAEVTNHAFTLALAHFPAHTLQTLKGDWVMARSRLERGIAVLRDDDLTLLLPTAVACSAWVLAQLGEEGEALSRLRESEELLEREAASGYVPYRGWAFHALGRACLRLDRLDEAQRLADCAVESSSRQPGFAAHALHLLGDISAHPDRLDAKKGEAHYRKALSLAEPRRMRPLVAHCHLGLGMLNGRTGKREQAQRHLSTSAAMYHDMGMPHWLQQAEVEMRQLP